MAFLIITDIIPFRKIDMQVENMYWAPTYATRCTRLNIAQRKVRMVIKMEFGIR